MVNKRRLSHGSTASSLLGDIVEEDEYPIENEGEGGGAGVAGGNRRRSMMGGGKNRRASCGASAAEQARIAEMYKTVIKMSSENVSPTLAAAVSCLDESLCTTCSLANDRRAFLTNYPHEPPLLSSHRKSTKRILGASISLITWAS